MRAGRSPARKARPVFTRSSRPDTWLRLLVPRLQGGGGTAFSAPAHSPARIPQTTPALPNAIRYRARLNATYSRATTAPLSTSRAKTRTSTALMTAFVLVLPDTGAWSRPNVGEAIVSKSSLYSEDVVCTWARIRNR